MAKEKLRATQSAAIQYRSSAIAAHQALSRVDPIAAATLPSVSCTFLLYPSYMGLNCGLALSNGVSSVAQIRGLKRPREASNHASITYNCVYCSKEFVERKELSQHYQSVHKVGLS